MTALVLPAPPMLEQVTPHFAVAEFACHSGEPYPPEWYQGRLVPLCRALEVLRDALGGQPVTIDSGYRTAAYNARIGGAVHSQHVEGRAADIVVAGRTPAEVHAVARDLWCRGLLQIGGLGLYPAWCHVDVREGMGHLAQWVGDRTSNRLA